MKHLYGTKLLPCRILGKTRPHSSYWMHVHRPYGHIWIRTDIRCPMAYCAIFKWKDLELHMHTIVARPQNVRGTNSGARRNH